MGKSLNKLNKATAAHAKDNDTSSVRHHRRSLSGTTTPTESPRPSVKRNASSMGIVRANTSHTNMKRNHSSGHLSRQSSSKNMLKHTKSDVAPSKRSLLKPGKERSESPPDHPSVRFDIGDDEPEDAWTEESTSQSPTTTRSNTRQNSVILDAANAPDSTDTQDGSDSNSIAPERSRSQMQTPPRTVHRKDSDASLSAAQQFNGSSSYKQSRPPDADMITSRLLRRASHHVVPPQMSSVSATVVADAHEPRSLSQSQGSTLAETPGKDLVSRFMDGEGSQGQYRDSSFLPSKEKAKQPGAGELAPTKRNKSAPNMAESSLLHSRTSSRRSGTTTPTDLNPSRTQQKLWLQRASSNIEPQKMIPVISSRAGGTQLLGASVGYSATGEGRVDPRLQRQFDQVTLEYKVVRRYRNPLGDALLRFDKLPASLRQAHTPKSPRSGHAASARHSRAPSVRSAIGNAGDHGGDGTTTPYEDPDDVEGRQSFESDGGRVFRTEAEEICRRLWESTEVSERAD